MPQETNAFNRNERTLEANISKKEEYPQDSLVNLAIERVHDLERMRENLERMLANSPEGHLRIHNKGNSAQYYYREATSDREGRYLLKNEKELAKSLAQKDYNQTVLQKINDELVSLKAFIASYKPNELFSVYSKMNKSRKKLVHPIVLPADEFVTNWLSAKYEGKVFKENMPEFYTAKGERVRSKTEVIIADMLYRYQVPYHYEYPLFIKGYGTIYPDFKCLNVRTRKEYYWEHHGKMGDEEYAMYAIRKIEQYAIAGYLPGENMIYTYESAEWPMNSRVIEKMIRTYLL